MEKICVVIFPTLFVYYDLCGIRVLEMLLLNGKKA